MKKNSFLPGHHDSYAPLCSNTARMEVYDDENAVPIVKCSSGSSCKPKVATLSMVKIGSRQMRRAVLKPSLLQQRLRLGKDPESSLSSAPPIIFHRPWETLAASSDGVWEFVDSEAAPASSWATLPNRSLLCRPLPLDVGRCTCIIVKEFSKGMSLYSLYTSEGRGREDRKLAIAHHRRQRGRSEFTIAQNMAGILCNSDEGFIGSVTANLIGSKYQIYAQTSGFDSMNAKPKCPMGVVEFAPTVSTLTGSYRSIKAWISKHPSMTQSNRTSRSRQETRSKTHQLHSKAPYYNTILKRYELDFKERSGLQVQPSVKNFQLIMEKGGRQTILQLGRFGKSTYLMDFRHPLTGFQALCICLTSIDSKLCCSV